MTLVVQRQPAWQPRVGQSAWYRKAQPTFADALAHVRRRLWRQVGFWLSAAATDPQKPPHAWLEHVAELLAYVT